MRHEYGNFFDTLAGWFRFANSDVAAYRTLGVSEAASDAEIEQAYLRLIAQYQPERLVGVAQPFRRRAEHKARQIEAAYALIRTSRKREAERHVSMASSRAAMAKRQDRDAPSPLVWVAVALVALVAIVGVSPLRELWMSASSQARLPAPESSAGTAPASNMPAPSVSASPTVAAPPPTSASPGAVPAAAGDKASVDRMLVLMPKDPPPAPRASSAPPALSGEAALVEALRAGQLRPATGGDLSRWAVRWAGANGRSVPAQFQERSGFMTSYVIQKDFTIPDGLTGAHSVIFLLDARVPYPRGDPGHSVVLDLSTGACMGTTCGMLLD